jgi:hypothetical protein
LNERGSLPLPVVDALALGEAHRALLRPDELLRDIDNLPHRLPRFFYRVDSWETALQTRVAEHFMLSELIAVDVREAPGIRRFPRYVPLAVTLLAAQLEVIRQAAGTYVFVSVNGGYRSAAHALTREASTHCWGTAANIYRIGDEYLDTEERIERFSKLALKVAPAVWVRPFGHEKGFADDHLHVDIGYARLSPRGFADTGQTRGDGA